MCLYHVSCCVPGYVAVLISTLFIWINLLLPLYYTVIHVVLYVYYLCAMYMYYCVYVFVLLHLVWYILESILMHAIKDFSTNLYIWSLHDAWSRVNYMTPATARTRGKPEENILYTQHLIKILTKLSPWKLHYANFIFITLNCGIYWDNWRCS